MLQKKQGQTDPLYKIFRVCDGLGTQGRTKEFLCKKKKIPFVWRSLLQSQGHDAGIMRRGREGLKERGRKMFEEGGMISQNFSSWITRH